MILYYSNGFYSLKCNDKLKFSELRQGAWKLAIQHYIDAHNYTTSQYFTIITTPDFVTIVVFSGLHCCNISLYSKTVLIKVTVVAVATVVVL